MRSNKVDACRHDPAQHQIVAPPQVRPFERREVLLRTTQYLDAKDDEKTVQQINHAATIESWCWKLFMVLGESVWGAPRYCPRPAVYFAYLIVIVPASLFLPIS